MHRQNRGTWARSRRQALLRNPTFQLPTPLPGQGRPQRLMRRRTWGQRGRVARCARGVRPQKAGTPKTPSTEAPASRPTQTPVHLCGQSIPPRGQLHVLGGWEPCSDPAAFGGGRLCAPGCPPGCCVINSLLTARRTQ